MKKMSEYVYHIGLKMRIYPSNQQREIIKLNGGASRYIYNKLVAGHNEMFNLKKTAHLSPADRERLNFLESVFSSKSNLVAMIPFLTINEIDSDMICNAFKNYQTAWNQFKKVKGTSVPTFHKKDCNYSYTTNNHYKKDCEDGLKDGSIYFIDDKHIRLPKIGKIRCKGSRKLIKAILNSDAEIRIGSVSVEMDNINFCYVSFSLASDEPFHTSYTKTNSIVGIDLNLSNFLADSNDNIVDSPRFLKQSEAKLKKAQRKLSRKLESAKKNKKKFYEVKNYNEQRLKVGMFTILR